MRNLIIAFLFTLSVTTYAQDAGFIWAKELDAVGEPDITEMVVDASDNVYLTGYFEGEVDFDPSASTALLTASGSDDIFIAKYDPEGDLLWVYKLGAAGRDQATGMVIDGSANLYICGYFEETVDFDPSGTSVNLASKGSTDGFVAKFNSSGQFQWAQQIGGTSPDAATAIDNELNGGVYVTGYFQGTVDFDPGTGTNSKSSNGLLDAFVVKFNSSGTYQSAFTFGGTSSEAPTDIAMDCCGAYIFLTGEFYSTNADFDPSSGTYLMSTNGSADIFLAKFGVQGQFYWAHSFGSTDYDQNAHIAVWDSPTGEQVYLTGSFINTIDLDPGVGISSVTSVDASRDIFLSKFDTDGNFQWGGSFGDSNWDIPHSIWTSGQLVFLAGEFRGTVDMDIGAGTSNITSSPTVNPNAFFTYYNGSGDLQYSKNITATWTRASSVYYSNNHVYLSGTFFGGSSDFDFGNGTFSLSTNSGPDEAFFAKYDYSVAIEPSQPSSLSFTGVSSSGMTLNFNSSGAEYYLILKKDLQLL